MPSGGGGSQPTSTTTTTRELSPEQRQLLDPVIPIAQDYLAQGLELYPESTVVGPTGAQQAARQDIKQTAADVVKPFTMGALGTAGAAQQQGLGAGLANLGTLTTAGGQGLGATGDIIAEGQDNRAARDFLSSGALLNPASNPVLGAQTQMAMEPIFTQLQEQTLPGIAGNFVGGNMFGSSRQGIAEGQAIDAATREAGRTATNLQANAFNQGLDAMQRAALGARDAQLGAATAGLGAGEAGTQAGLNAALQSLSQSPSLAQLAFVPGMTLEGIGEQERQFEQARVSEEANRYLTEQMIPFLQAQDVASLAFGIPAGSTVAKSTQAQPNAGNQWLGAGISALAMLPFL